MDDILHLIIQRHIQSHCYMPCYINYINSQVILLGLVVQLGSILQGVCYILNKTIFGNIQCSLKQMCIPCYICEEMLSTFRVLICKMAIFAVAFVRNKRNKSFWAIWLIKGMQYILASLPITYTHPLVLYMRKKIR